MRSNMPLTFTEDDFKETKSPLTFTEDDFKETPRFDASTIDSTPVRITDPNIDRSQRISTTQGSPQLRESGTKEAVDILKNQLKESLDQSALDGVLTPETVQNTADKI